MMQPRSIATIRAAKIGYIVMSAAFCLLGLALIVFPQISARVICEVVGIMLIFFGIVKLVGYFSKDLYRLAFQYDLAFGLLMMVLDTVTLLRSDHVMNFICIAFGISSLVDGLLKVQISLESMRFGIGLWWLILTAAVITGIAGILLIFRPAEGGQILVILLGISLVTEGILNLSTVLTAVKIIRHQLPDIIDADEDSDRKD